MNSMVFFKKHRFTVMLGLMVVFIIFVPMMGQYNFGYDAIVEDMVNTLLFSLLLISGISAVNDTRRSVFFAVVLVGLGIIFKSMYLILDDGLFFIAYHIVYIVFLAAVIFSITVFLFKNQHVDSNMISASLCCFLLLGLFWAVLYSLTVYCLPDAFYISESGMSNNAMYFGSGSSTLAVYFSFVTLTTLGYGDIYPVVPAVQMLAASEALVGQLYLVVIVARLVGLHIVHVKPIK